MSQPRHARPDFSDDWRTALVVRSADGHVWVRHGGYFQPLTGGWYKGVRVDQLVGWGDGQPRVIVDEHGQERKELR